MDITHIAVTLFLIMDPFGNLPVIVSLLKNFDKSQKIKILTRELIFSLIFIIIFIFFGKILWNFLD